MFLRTYIPTRWKKPPYYVILHTPNKHALNLRYHLCRPSHVSKGVMRHSHVFRS